MENSQINLVCYSKFEKCFEQKDFLGYTGSPLRSEVIDKLYL